MTPNTTCKSEHEKLVAASGIDQGAGYDKSEGEFAESAVSANGRIEDGGNSLYSSHKNTAEGEMQYAHGQLHDNLMIGNTYADAWILWTKRLAKISESYEV